MEHISIYNFSYKVFAHFSRRRSATFRLLKTNRESYELRKEVLLKEERSRPYPGKLH